MKGGAIGIAEARTILRRHVERFSRLPKVVGRVESDAVPGHPACAGEGKCCLHRGKRYRRTNFRVLLERVSAKTGRRTYVGILFYVAQEYSGGFTFRGHERARRREFFEAPGFDAEARRLMSGTAGLAASIEAMPAEGE